MGAFPVVNGHLVVRHDSSVTALDALVRTWRAGLTQGGAAPHRLELFSMAALDVRVRQYADAQQCIETWLATPGLTDVDRAWILSKSIKLFYGLLSPQHPKDPLPPPEQLVIAHRYLARLEALPASVRGIYLFEIYHASMGLALRFGRVDTAIAYGMRAFALPAEATDYQTRIGMASGGEALITFALALSAYPERYQHTIDSLITKLRGYLMAPIPTAYAQYPWNMNLVTELRAAFEERVKLVQTIGRPAPALVATDWFNQSTPTPMSDVAPEARIKPLNDGVVRLIGFGFFGCPACHAVMAQWQRFQHDLPPGAELLFYERSSGSWGGDLIEPKEEAGHLRHYYVERKHYTYPIAVWAGPKVPNDEGGHVPLYSPTMKTLGFFGGPHFIIVDGNGTLRYRSDMWSEIEMLRVLTQLTQEQRHHTATTAATATPTAMTP